MLRRRPFQSFEHVPLADLRHLLLITSVIEFVFILRLEYNWVHFGESTFLIICVPAYFVGDCKLSPVFCFLYCARRAPAGLTASGEVVALMPKIALICAKFVKNLVETQFLNTQQRAFSNWVPRTPGVPEELFAVWRALIKAPISTLLHSCKKTAVMDTVPCNPTFCREIHRFSAISQTAA